MRFEFIFNGLISGKKRELIVVEYGGLLCIGIDYSNSTT